MLTPCLKRLRRCPLTLALSREGRGNQFCACARLFFGKRDANGQGPVRSTVKALLLSLSLASISTLADEPPARVQDLHYGSVLFDYYQGNSFEALTGLAVARTRGGIQGHGTDPLLVEGGLMLTYGMTREAKHLFEQLLTDAVEPSKRNQAWFYLGKVFYLEQDPRAATDALARVAPELLQQSAPELHQEWLYLKGLLLLNQQPSAQADAELDRLLESLPPTSLWRAYLRYNRAVRALTDQPAQASSALQQLADDLKLMPVTDEQAEAIALRERVLLSLGQLQLQEGQVRPALNSLQAIRLDSPFSDQALFHYAAAAARGQEPELALQALNTLQDRPLFTAWLQQVPYARGFVLEQLGDRQQALAAYKDAAVRYEALTQTLAEQRERLNEADLVAALRLDDADARPLQLGAPEVARDPYGRLQVQPADFSLASLLASEPFQIGLRDLHELYRLQDHLARWQRQLDSFELMLATRAQLRSQRIAETRVALAERQADQWLAQQAEFNKQITEAVEQEDAAFFMTEEQQAYARKIETLQDTLAILPDNETTAAQRERARRIQAYFDWWVADQYAVNRWAAEKQLYGLNQAMDGFQQQTGALEREMGSDGENAALTARVRDNQQALTARRAELDQALQAARQVLLEQVRAELTRQAREVREYLRAARQAQARLADELFQATSKQPDGGQP